MRSWLIEIVVIAGMLVSIVGTAWGAEAARGADVPTYLNPEMVHVSVENAEPNQYLSICPNVCELGDGRLLIAYHRTTRVDFSGEYSTFTRTSSDGGKSWSEPRLMQKHMQAPGLLCLADGTVLLNGCTVIDDRWSTTMRLFRSSAGKGTSRIFGERSAGGERPTTNILDVPFPTSVARDPGAE